MILRRARRSSPSVARASAIVAVVVSSLLAAPGGGVVAGAGSGFSFETRTLDGRRNNLARPEWGAAGTIYRRVAPSAYGDDRGGMRDGPSPRYVSNRIFNDVGQNLFSERGVSQWGTAWGQFLDHTFGLRRGSDSNAPLAFDNEDPLERFVNELGMIPFRRSKGGRASGSESPRDQTNTVSSYIDAWTVYGGTRERLDWLRAGSLDGNPTNNRAALLLTRARYLPRASIRGDAPAPEMELVGRLFAAPQRAVIAGDLRANENIALTAVHTLFAREHNRIAAALPGSLSHQQRFEIARRVVGAELQFITYREFLPALGVRLAPYQGYLPQVNSSLSNEFATVAYRGHSMVHGDVEAVAERGRYTANELESFEEAGIEVTREGGELELEIPLTVAFGNPGLVPRVGLGPLLAGLGSEAQYANDEQIDEQLRSVLFQVPGPGVEDPSSCFEPTPPPECFSGVIDLGAIDIQRGRDHGMPYYNDLRAAFGLAPRQSFTVVTGESTDRFPVDPEIDPADPMNDPDILDFTALFDADGQPVEPGSDESEEGAVRGVRRSSLAARLKAIYGTVDELDPFVGMVSEPRVPGSELGPLQLAIWREQFEALRDGDRFFYRNDPVLARIRNRFGIDFRKTLAEVILANTGVEELQEDVFFAAEDEG